MSENSGSDRRVECPECGASGFLSEGINDAVCLECGHEWQLDGRGLCGKYEVRKDGEPVEVCFVLEPDDDPAARDALLAYAQSTEDDALANDLIDWMSQYSHTDRDDGNHQETGQSHE